MADPIMWAKRGDSFARPAREWDPELKAWTTPTDDMGMPRLERIPQTGRVGVVRQVEDIATTRPMQDPRSIRYLRTEGHEIHAPIRSAAAALNGDKNTDRSFRENIVAKASFYGWLQVGCCPVDEVMRRIIMPERIVSPMVREAIRDRKPCSQADVGGGKPPCPHYLAERDARRARQVKFEEQRAKSLKSDSDKLAEKQTEAIGALVERLAVKPEEPAPVAPPAPTKGNGK